VTAPGRTDAPPGPPRPEPVAPRATARREHLAGYLLVGAAFGLVLTKGEVISWFRIQEMFRFQGFHMYGVIGSAVAVAALSVRALRWSGIRAFSGAEIRIEPKPRGRRSVRYWLGGTIFGLGWGLLGACPGPIYALIGAGVTVAVVALAAALAGTWTYARLQPRLPHD
jgi:uncharacterized membrane protein YedE/YeeE